MVHFPAVLFISTFLLTCAVSCKQRTEHCCLSDIRVENSNIKNVFLNLQHQTPFIAMSSLALSSIFAIAPCRVSLVTGCNFDSLQTSLHTSVRRFAVESHYV